MVLRGLPRCLFDLVLYQVGWCICIFGTAGGRQWAGPAYALFALLAHLAIVPDPKRTLFGVLVIGVFGFVVDGLWTALGLLAFPGQELVFGWLPPWMVALWLMFAFLLDSALRFLRTRLALAAVLGAVAGPLAYLGGEGLGALDVHGIAAVLAVAVGWAVALPFAVLVFLAVDPSHDRAREAAAAAAD